MTNVPKLKTFLLVEFIVTVIVGGWQYLESGIEAAVFSSLTMLIAFSPFCLGLTTPLVLKLAGKMVDELTIKMKSANALITLSAVDTVAISMNNIITNGDYYITDLVPEGLSQSSLLSYAAAAERDSNYILGKKIYETAEQRRLIINSVAAFREIPGQGVEALMNNTPIRVGRPQWIENEGVEISAELLTKVDQLAVHGKKVLMLSMGKMARGIIALKDEVDQDSKEFLEQLKKLGFETMMLSGENKRTVSFVSKNVTVDNVRFSLSPEDKARELQILRTKNKTVAMIGAEVRDLPALLTADVSFLLNNGEINLNDSEVQVDFEISNLEQFIEVHKIAQKVKKIIKQNQRLVYLSWILLLPIVLMIILNLQLIPPIHPFIAAAVVLICSALILANSTRVKKEQNK